jgi:hypothetical protein
VLCVAICRQERLQHGAMDRIESTAMDNIDRRPVSGQNSRAYRKHVKH